MKTKCSNCKQLFEVEDEHQGKQIECLKCKKMFTIAPYDANIQLKEIEDEASIHLIEKFKASSEKIFRMMISALVCFIIGIILRYIFKKSYFDSKWECVLVSTIAGLYCVAFSLGLVVLRHYILFQCQVRKCLKELDSMMMTTIISLVIGLILQCILQNLNHHYQFAEIYIMITICYSVAFISSTILMIHKYLVFGILLFLSTAILPAIEFVLLD